MPFRSLTEAAIDNDHAAEYIRINSYPLEASEDLDPLIDRIGDKKVVMLGEASHGTHEYYTWRTRISKRLIREKGFNFIAVEGDWPDCYKLNRYIKRYTEDKDARSVVHQFDRWPTWMWANWEVVALAEWMHEHNKPLSREKRIGFYGLDVYSLWESLNAVMNYLEKVDKQALKVAQQAFKCFEPYKGDDGHDYASALRLVPELCETEVVNMLSEVRKRMPLYDSDHENVFSVEQNSLVAVNAEWYYRSMLSGGASSWNVRDTHMEQTLERLLEFHGPDAKAIVWEHNTHIGDARFTDMNDEGMFNIGELARERFGKDNVALVGFGSYEGTVIAGSAWGDEMRIKEVPRGKRNSWEFMLHLASPENKLLLLDEYKDPMFEGRIGHRAIGVVYNPQYEHFGNYVPSVVPQRYDAFLFIDQTKALHPLHLKPHGQEMPDTYPFGE